MTWPDKGCGLYDHRGIECRNCSLYRTYVPYKLPFISTTVLASHSILKDHVLDSLDLSIATDISLKATQSSKI